MAYEFVADAEKMEELNNDLVNTANEIAGFVEDIYSKVDDLNTVWSGDSYNSFKAKCDSYKVSLNQLPEILNAFAVELGALGGDTNTMVVSIKALLDCSDMTIKDGSAGTRTVQTNTRAKDANGAYIPDNNTYSDVFVIPADTTVGSECWACAEVGDDLYIKALQIEGNVNTETAQLIAYRDANMAAINSLPPAQRDAVLNYLNTEISKRQDVSKKISDATHDALIIGDGALFNCTSYGLTGNSVVGWTQQSTVDTAVECAQNINKDLRKMSDFSDIEAYMMDCGLGSIGG